MINLVLFQKRLEAYKAMDYGFNFYPFWKWKISVEKSGAHILDKINLRITHEKLMPIMRYWQTYRPLDTEICSERLAVSLKEMADAYDNVRKYDLLTLDKAPIDDLKIIWNKLGRVKETDGAEKRVSNYYVIAVCKPLMFLWGQTIAFDNLVRNILRNIGFKWFTDNKWAFDLWYRVMNYYRKQVIEQPEFIELSKICSKEMFGTEEFVPYGQFLDLYYWVKAKEK